MMRREVKDRSYECMDRNHFYCDSADCECFCHDGEACIIRGFD